MFSFSHNLNYALGWTVIHSLWQVMLIALLAGVVLIALRKSTARLRYFVAMTSLLLVLWAALTTFFVYYDFSKEPGEVVFAPDAALQTASVTLENQSDKAVTETFANHKEVASTGLSWDGLKTYVNRNIYLIVMFWLMGVTLFLLRLLGSVSYISFLRAKHNFPVEDYWQEMLDKLCQKVQWNTRIELVESALVRSPMVVGFLKPMILFPIGAINRLNPEEVEAILAHEMAHVLRHDYALNILQSVVEALFFFHPGVWWLSAQARNERENSCDDMAISLCGNSVTYAKSLVSVQEMAYYTPLMAMGFAGQRTAAGNQLLHRVQRALQHKSSSQSKMEKIVSTAILALVVVGLAFGSQYGNYKVTEVSDISQGQPKSHLENEAKTFGKPNFIKYTINGCMDSLPVDNHVKDGTYYFSDNTQEVALTVKDKSVIRFNINGLEVDSDDIPKFAKLINKIVQAEKEANTTRSSQAEGQSESHFEGYDSDSEIEQIPPPPSDETFIVVNEKMLTNLSDKPITITEKTGKKYVIIGDKNKVKMVTITAPGEKPMVLAMNENYQALRNNTPIDAKELKALGWKTDNGSLEKIGGFKDVRSIQEGFGGQPDSFQEVGSTLGWLADVITSHSDEERKPYESDERSDTPPPPPSTPDGGARFNYSLSSNDDDEGGKDMVALGKKYDEWLLQALYKDGYITDKKHYHWRWTNEAMQVNGKKVSQPHFEKYTEKWAEYFGSDPDDDFSRTKTVSEN